MYVVVVGGLLFLAFAYFAFAQAAVARNAGQSAADAAALAAAHDVRDELTEGFYEHLGDPEAWPEWLAAEELFTGDGSDAAAQLADENDSDLDGGQVQPTEVNGYPAFEARIVTRFTVGDSVIPDTENTHAKADATAVIEPRCEIVGSDPSKLIEIDCEGSGLWKIDPKTPVAELIDPPEANDLFFVHLAE